MFSLLRKFRTFRPRVYRTRITLIFVDSESLSRAIKAYRVASAVESFYSRRACTWSVRVVPRGAGDRHFPAAGKKSGATLWRESPRARSRAFAFRRESSAAIHRALVPFATEQAPCHVLSVAPSSVASKGGRGAS